MRAIQLGALALFLFASSVYAQSAQHVRGDIASIEGTKLIVHTRTGDTIPIELADNYKVVAVVPASRGALKEGAFVGAAAMPEPDGTQRALEVLVFPESGRGSGEGHYPWDLKPGSTMTNATVAEVAKVDQGERLTLKYKDGEKTVVVPHDVPIVTFEPGSREMLRSGAHVLVRARPKPDGSLTAASVLVGKDGLVPPM